MIVIEVADTGNGIPAEEIPSLFERNWKVQRSTKGRGSGLGLAIAKGIVDAHGGRIWVESAPSVGSTFSVALPVATQS
jgi:signal transduction histidine kinase